MIDIPEMIEVQEYSRDDRGSRYSSRQESRRDNSRSSKPRSDKFLKKTREFLCKWFRQIL